MVFYPPEFNNLIDPLKSDISVSPETSKNGAIKKETKVEQIRQENLNPIPKKAEPVKEDRYVNLLIDLTAKVNQKSKSSTKFKDLYSIILKNKLNASEQDYVYKLLENKFREIEFINTPQAWVQRADLLDAIDLLVEKYKLSPLPILMEKTSESPWKEGTVPLIPYNNLKQATEKLNELGTQTLRTTSDVQEKLGKLSAGEYTSTAKTIRRLTRQNQWGASFLGIFYRFVTAFLGKYYNHPSFFGKTLDQISLFSKKMGIQSIEVLSQKVRSADGKAEQFYYRGPRYLFGQSVHDYKTINEWFKRDLTPAAREEYLNRVRYKESKLESLYGPAELEESRVVISNSDCRLRFHQLESGEFGKPQELTGKVLNPEAEQLAKLRKEDPIYYEEKYKFTTKNLLGRNNDASMDPRQLDQKQKEALTKQIDVLTENISRIDSKQAKEETVKLRNKILKQENTQTILNQAQHELLGGIYRAFDEEGAVQVIQRLAPADVHNYVAPLDGTPLSHKEAVKLLRERVENKQKYLIEQGRLDTVEQAKIEKEIEVYKDLEEIFLQQEKLLGRSSQASVDIYGTNASVSTPAILNQSSILAQNDRKVVLYKHEDGSFSLHVFIGATGVNRVDVDPDTFFKKQGTRQGDMQFGRDIYTAKDGYLAAGDSETKDGLPKLRLGEREGEFPINGSTVISYYLPTDFELLSKAKELTKVAAYGEGQERATIEILAKMGDPIAVKKEIALAKIIEQTFPEPFANLSSLDNILDQLTEFSSQLDTPNDESLLLIKKLWSGEPLSLSEFNLRENVENLLGKRLEILRDQDSIRQSMNLTKEDVDDLRELDELSGIREMFESLSNT